jgi:rhomboid family GlyGly-CTERM serine protease
MRGMRAPRGTLVFVVLALLAGAVPRVVAGLEYDRAAMLRGEIWRPVTGQLVHWSWPMAVADLGVLALAGALVERRSARAAWLGLAAALLVVGIAVTLSPGLLRYRGSSGVATAMVALGLTYLRLPLALGGLSLLGAKTAFEVVTGQPVLPGTLPPGIDLTPAAHLAGALAGLGVGLVTRPRA